MEFALRGTEVTIIGEPNIGFAQNNLVNSIAGNVDTEEGWEFTLSVFMTTIQKFNSIKMTRDGDIVYAQLTNDMMPVGGRYEGQFVMTKGDQVSHSDVFNFWVENSINLNAVWTPIPTEFRQIEENMRIMNQNPPVPGDNGKWMVYNPETGEYEQSNANLPQDYSSLPIASANTLGGVKIGEGINVAEDGTISVENTGGGGEPTSGITQEEADARYLQLAGGTMTGNIDMGGNNVDNVAYVKAAGSYENAGIQFSSNGTIMNFVTGYSSALELSANSVNVVNHNIRNVAGIEMSNSGIITGLGTPVNDGDATNKQYVDNAISEATSGGGTSGITQDQADQRYLQLSGGTMTGAINMGTQNLLGVGAIVNGDTPTANTAVTLSNGAISFDVGSARVLSLYGSAINAVNHRIQNVSNPQDNTDAANKQYVDTSVSGVQTNIDTVSGTVDDILDGTEALPYLPDNGGTLTGALNMGNNKITMGATPTETTDVTNKGYVDGVVKVVSDEVDGILAGTTPVAIPAATETHIGGIKPGAGTAVSGDGTLTIIVPVPTAEDNGKILVAENGVYVLKTLAELQG